MTKYRLVKVLLSDDCEIQEWRTKKTFEECLRAVYLIRILCDDDQWKDYASFDNLGSAKQALERLENNKGVESILVEKEF